MEKEIVISNDLNEITRIAQFVEELGMSLKLPSGVTMSVNLAIEEAIASIIHNAYLEDQVGEITLRVNIASGVLAFIIIDDGISFDPTSKEALDHSLTLEQQLTEGLGLCLIRRTMDEVDYHTVDGLNQLVLVKRIDMEFKPEATMKTNLCKIDDVTILAIEGRLDTANALQFNNVIQPLLSGVALNIIINCEGMTYISSSGLRSLIVLQKSVFQHGGNLTIEAIKPEIKKIFDMTGCSTLFTIR